MLEFSQEFLKLECWNLLYTWTAGTWYCNGVVLTSVGCNDVLSTSFQRHVPTRFSINQCQIITFPILKSDNIENSRIEMKGIVLPVPSNQIKVTFIIILPFNLVHLWFFAVSNRNWKRMWVDYLGGQWLCWPPFKFLSPPPPPPPPPPPTPSSYAYDCGIENRTPCLSSFLSFCI